jgi:hypothetical protein
VQPANSLLNGLRDQAQGAITGGPAGSSASKHVPNKLVLIREVSLQHTVVQDSPGGALAAGQGGQRVALPIFIEQSGLNADADLPSVLADEQGYIDPVDSCSFLTRKAVKFEEAPEASESLGLALDGCFDGGFTGKRIAQKRSNAVPTFMKGGAFDEGLTPSQAIVDAINYLRRSERLCRTRVARATRGNALSRNGRGGKISSEIKWLGREPNLSEDDVLEIAVRNGRWVLTHAPAEPRPARPPAQHYFPTQE